MIGVWSHADVRRGRFILIALGALIAAKEAVVAALAFFRSEIIDPNWLPVPGSWVSEHKGWLILAAKAIILWLTYHRWSGFRLVLAAIYVATAVIALGGLVHSGLSFSGLPLAALFNAALGLLIGILLITLSPLQAYEEAYAPGRVTVPIAPPETPARGAGRRLLQRVGALIWRFLMLVPALGVLAVVAYFMNWHVYFGRLLGPFLHH